MDYNKLLSDPVEIKGHKFRTFITGDVIPQVRLEAYVARQHEYEQLGLKREHLHGFVKTLEEAGNAGDYSEIMQLVGYFKMLIEKPVTVNMVAYMVSALVLIDDEHPDRLEKAHEDKKFSLALQYPEIERFFLATLHNFGFSMKDSLDSGQAPDYTKPTNPVMKNIEKIWIERITGSLIMM